MMSLQTAMPMPVPMSACVFIYKIHFYIYIIVLQSPIEQRGNECGMTENSRAPDRVLVRDACPERYQSIVAMFIPRQRPGAPPWHVPAIQGQGGRFPDS